MSKVWLVTGSASGLGREIAEAVLASGDRLMATARDPQRLTDLTDRYGKHVSTAPLDVADETAARTAVARAVDVFGRLDVLVNNAGYGDTAPFEQVSSERFRALIETNFFGVVFMTRAVLPIMRKQQSGCILQISSVGGRLATPGRCCLSRREMGSRRIHGIHCSGSCALRGEGMCSGTRWHANQLGQSRPCGYPDSLARV
jgi:NAD(P)-dependent dehydrogenase (short-subunit alcohol dehydrogenase family)